MSWRSTLVLAAGLAVGLSYAPAATAVRPNEPTARKTVLVVRGESEFAAAVQYFRYSGGRIVLRP